MDFVNWDKGKSYVDLRNEQGVDIYHKEDQKSHCYCKRFIHGTERYIAFNLSYVKSLI